VVIVVLLEQRQRAPSEVVGSRVLEPRVRGTGIDEEGQPQLTHVPEARNAGVSMSSKLSGSRRMLFQMDRE
jgi:hypothetical protein